LGKEHFCLHRGELISALAQLLKGDKENIWFSYVSDKMELKGQLKGVQGIPNGLTWSLALGPTQTIFKTKKRVYRHFNKI